MKYTVHLQDLEFIKCPLCDKDMVQGRWHGCKPLLHSDEYVNATTGILLAWYPHIGWHSVKFSQGIVVEKLSFADVFNWVIRDKRFVPTGDWEVPKAVKNVY